MKYLADTLLMCLNEYVNIFIKESKNINKSFISKIKLDHDVYVNDFQDSNFKFIMRSFSSPFNKHGYKNFSIKWFRDLLKPYVHEMATESIIFLNENEKIKDISFVHIAGKEYSPEHSLCLTHSSKKIKMNIVHHQFEGIILKIGLYFNNIDEINIMRSSWIF